MAGKQYPILSRKEAAEKANVSVVAISSAINRGELTQAKRLNTTDYRTNGVYIYEDEYFQAYLEHLEVTNYRNSGRRSLEM